MATVNDTSPSADMPEQPAPLAREAVQQAKAKVGDAARTLKGQATDKAREYALLGKDKATGGLDGLYALIDDAANAIDDKVGPELGTYAHRVAEAVAGLNDGIKAKDVEELLEDAKTIIRKNPALAIGAAAVAGFVITRVLKAGYDENGATDTADGGASNKSHDDGSDVASVPSAANIGVGNAAPGS